VPWGQHADPGQVIGRLKTEGYCLMAVEQTLQAVPVDVWTPPSGRPIALVFGNELHGVTPSVIEACDGSLVVPQHGAKHSLNVSVCAGIVLWWLAGRSVSLPFG
jgi:tRNA G18 (ribose-2'-O)-methylase SpoU